MNDNGLNRTLWVIEDLVSLAQTLSRDESERIQERLKSLEWDVVDIRSRIRGGWSYSKEEA